MNARGGPHLGLCASSASVLAKESHHQPLTKTLLTVSMGLKATSVTRKGGAVGETAREILKQEAGGKEDRDTEGKEETRKTGKRGVLQGRGRFGGVCYFDF